MFPRLSPPLSLLFGLCCLLLSTLSSSFRSLLIWLFLVASSHRCVVIRCLRRQPQQIKVSAFPYIYIFQLFCVVCHVCRLCVQVFQTLSNTAHYSAVADRMLHHIMLHCDCVTIASSSPEAEGNSLSWFYAFASHVEEKYTMQPRLQLEGRERQLLHTVQLCAVS